MLRIYGPVHDYPLLENGTVQHVAAWCMTHPHMLRKATVWAEHPGLPNSHGIIADEWLLHADAAGMVEPLAQRCQHRRTEVRYWPTDHLFCLDCKEKIA